MEMCKGCGGAKLVKNGRNKLGAQRYKCKDCNCTFIEGDRRLKHGLEKRLKVINMYLEGVSNPLIIYWIKHFAELIRKEIRKRLIPENP